MLNESDLRRAIRRGDEEEVREIIQGDFDRDFEKISRIFDEERRGRQRFGRIEFGDLTIRDRLGRADIQ